MSRKPIPLNCLPHPTGHRPFHFSFADHDHTVDGVFGAGNGRVAEVMCTWLADLDFVPKVGSRARARAVGTGHDTGFRDPIGSQYDRVKWDLLYCTVLMR